MSEPTGKEIVAALNGGAKNDTPEARIEELERYLATAIDALTGREPGTLKERLQRQQIRMLADRLSLVMGIFHDQEFECGIAGDAEGAETWERARRMLIGRDNEHLQYMRAHYRKNGEYKLALTQVRAWLARSLAKMQRPRAAPKEEAA